MPDIADLDAQTDAPLEAIAALVHGAIQADLGNGVLKGIFRDPRDLLTLQASQLPALAIYRTRERRVRHTEDQLAHVITVTFEYLLPATALQAREGRWPALQAVWGTLSDAVLAGSHEAVSDGASVLELAECYAEEDSADVLYGLAEDSAANYPRFIGTIVVRHVADAVDVSALNDFLTLYTAFFRVEEVPATAVDPDDPHAATLADNVTTLEAAD